MKINGEAIYGSKGSPLQPLPWGRCTRKESEYTTTLYLEVFDWPKDGKLIIPGVTNEITSATLLANGKLLKTAKNNDAIVINVPQSAPGKIASVVKLLVKGKVPLQNFAAVVK